MNVEWPIKREAPLWMAAILIALSSCANGPAVEPKVECRKKPLAGKAIICIRTVSMDFGPADQFLGYSAIHGQQLVSLKKEAALAVFPLAIEHTKTFIKDIDEIAKDDRFNSYASGARGVVTMSVDAGEHIICSQSKNEYHDNQKILSCEPLEVEAAHTYRLLVVDNPRAGIQFVWK